MTEFFIQSARLQALGIFAAVFLFAALVVLFTAVASRLSPRSLDGVSASMMSPLGAMFALMTAFLAATEVQNHSDGVAAANAEARALSEARLAALDLSPPVDARVQHDIQDYVSAVTHDEWPRLTSIHSEDDPVSVRTALPLLDALNVVEAANATDDSADMRTTETALRDALDARSRRLNVAAGIANRFEFYAALVLGLLLVALIAVVHHKSWLSRTVAVGMIAIGVATSLTTIAVQDDPFSGGRGITAKSFAYAASYGTAASQLAAK